MRLVDVSPTLTPHLPGWPGDTGFSLTPKWSIAQGAAVNVASVTTSTHFGAHIDAPLHVIKGAADVSLTPLEACIGDCLIVDVANLIDRSRSPHGFVPVDRLIEQIDAVRRRAGTQNHPLPARVLLKHRTTPLREWDSDTPGVDPRFIEWFARQGGVLLGLDLQSFDPEVCAQVPAHLACVDAEIVMLEGLELSHAEEGPAELIALPIAWQGADAAPVRAVLRYDDH